MLRLALRRAVSSAAPLFCICKPIYGSLISTFTSSSSSGNHGADPVTLQMISYALGHARTQRTEESYAQALLVLEQGLSNLRQGDGVKEDSVGMFLLAMSTLLSEREQLGDAIGKLHGILDLVEASLGVKVSAYEGLIGLNLEAGQDVTSSMLADECVQLLASTRDNEDNAMENWRIRANGIKGLIDLVMGNIASAESYFHKCHYNDSTEAKYDMGNVAFSHGEFLHATGRFSLAKDLYQKALETSEINDSSAAYPLSASCMTSGKFSLATTCALGQLATHSGNFIDAEEILTKTLTKTEEHFGSNHPNVGIVLTCIAVMFGQKAKLEQSSSILIQEGLYRRAIDLLKSPPLDAEEVGEMPVNRRDVMALARGGYGEILSVQQNRKGEGERMKKWAESIWRNHRMSLAEALEIADPSKVAVIDARICRVV